jgi:GH25 family lysozyme M1 (1,4-beta-N-acetylmuramidase)
MPEYPGIIWGFDISGVQWEDCGNKSPNFRKAADAGFRFVYIQSSRYSKTKENHFDRMVEDAQNAGLKVGAYHFCSQQTDPIAQADFFRVASGGLGVQPGDLPPILDWEYCTPTYYVERPETYPLGHPGHCVDWIAKAAVRTEENFYGVEQSYEAMPIGRKPGIYTYPNYGATHQPALGQSLQLGTFPLHLASYLPGDVLPSEGHIPSHRPPAPWSKATIVQVVGNGGYVPGVVGPCDIDCFIGSEEEFLRFAGLYPKELQKCTEEVGK